MVTLYPFSVRRETQDMTAVPHFVAMHNPASRPGNGHHRAAGTSLHPDGHGPRRISDEARARWRRRRDLNPREGITLNPLSRRAP